ncbi:MAG TPA: hypothetical protein VHG91_03965 [Longimicrobium sp.]|nr:hypothetical protein [Longimicrobium sp.]
MKKLALELDALEVESFATVEEDAERGTVEARESDPSAVYPYCTLRCKTQLTYCPCTP